MDHCEDGPLVGNTPFDTFRHQLVDIGRAVLEIAVGSTIGHCAYRAHAAIGLVGASLEHVITSYSIHYTKLYERSLRFLVRFTLA